MPDREIWILSDAMTGEDTAAIVEPDDFAERSLDKARTWEWQRPGERQINRFAGTFDELLTHIRGRVN